MTQSLPAPGWYVDPAGELRYWDGVEWTVHTSAPDQLASHHAPGRDATTVRQLPKPLITGNLKPTSTREYVMVMLLVLLLLGLSVGYSLNLTKDVASSPAPAPTSFPVAQVPAAAPSTPSSKPSPALSGFALDPPLGRDAHGAVEVFHASGRGSMTSPVFSLRGDSVSGVFVVDDFSGQVFLDRVPGPPSHDPVVRCGTRCGDPWHPMRAPASGRYVVRVVAPGSTWSLTLVQWVEPPLSMSFTAGPQGATRLTASGFGSRESAPFLLRRTPKSGLSGNFQDDGALEIYLVPVGKTLDPRRDLLVSGEAGMGGGWGGDRPTGRYYLVVRTQGPWRFDIQSG